MITSLALVAAMSLAQPHIQFTAGGVTCPIACQVGGYQNFDIQGQVIMKWMGADGNYEDVPTIVALAGCAREGSVSGCDWISYSVPAGGATFVPSPDNMFIAGGFIEVEDEELANLDQAIARPLDPMVVGANFHRVMCFFFQQSSGGRDIYEMIHFIAEAAFYSGGFWNVGNVADDYYWLPLFSSSDLRNLTYWCKNRGNFKLSQKGDLMRILAQSVVAGTQPFPFPCPECPIRPGDIPEGEDPEGEGEGDGDGETEGEGEGDGETEGSGEGEGEGEGEPEGQFLPIEYQEEFPPCDPECQAAAAALNDRINYDCGRIVATGPSTWGYASAPTAADYEAIIDGDEIGYTNGDNQSTISCDCIPDTDPPYTGDCIACAPQVDTPGNRVGVGWSTYGKPFPMRFTFRRRDVNGGPFHHFKTKCVWARRVALAGSTAPENNITQIAFWNGTKWVAPGTVGSNSFAQGQYPYYAAHFYGVSAVASCSAANPAPYERSRYFADPCGDTDRSADGLEGLVDAINGLGDSLNGSSFGNGLGEFSDGSYNGVGGGFGDGDEIGGAAYGGAATGAQGLGDGFGGDAAASVGFIQGIDLEDGVQASATIAFNVPMYGEVLLDYTVGGDGAPGSLSETVHEFRGYFRAFLSVMLVLGYLRRFWNRLPEVVA